MPLDFASPFSRPPSGQVSFSVRRVRLRSPPVSFCPSARTANRATARAAPRHIGQKTHSAPSATGEENAACAVRFDARWQLFVVCASSCFAFCSFVRLLLCLRNLTASTGAFVMAAALS